MFKKINKKFVFLYLILLILIIFLLRNSNNLNLVENLSNNCGSCSSENGNGNGKVGWFSFLGPLFNNQFAWSIEDAKNEFVNTLDGTTVSASSNPTLDQFRK